MLCPEADDFQASPVDLNTGSEHLLCLQLQYEKVVKKALDEAEASEKK